MTNTLVPERSNGEKVRSWHPAPAPQLPKASYWMASSPWLPTDHATGRLESVAGAGPVDGGSLLLASVLAWVIAIAPLAVVAATAAGVLGAAGQATAQARRRVGETAPPA